MTEAIEAMAVMVKVVSASRGGEGGSVECDGVEGERW
jgi:hypothetical protein